MTPTSPLRCGPSVKSAKCKEDGCGWVHPRPSSDTQPSGQAVLMAAYRHVEGFHHNVLVTTVQEYGLLKDDV